MTGEEHYREAERLLESAAEEMKAAAAGRHVELVVPLVQLAIAAAQVHAQLAGIALLGAMIQPAVTPGQEEGQS